MTLAAAVDPNDLVGDLKERISEWVGMPVENLVLLHLGAAMNGGSTIEEIGLESGGIIFVVLIM